MAAASHEATGPAVRSIGLLRPLSWLARGVGDLWHHPGASLFYGFCTFVAGMVVLVAVARLPYLFAAAVSGFLLVAPIVATGLYDLSRRREQGEPLRLAESMRAWRRNPSGLVGFGLFSLLAGTAWQVVSVVIVALLYRGNAAVPADVALEILLNPQYLNLFLLYVGIGGLFAAIVFALSVVSVPMLLDRQCDLLDAMQASLAAVAANPLPLAFWAALLMTLTLLGFASGLLGFIVLMPVLGHASWHAYRDLIEP